MKKNEITVRVKLDAAAFRRFAVFDNLILRRRWGRPVLFCVLMAAFAAVCFCLKKEQSVLIGSLLLILGAGMPLVYFGTFFYQIRAQIKRLGLKTPQAAYTLRFGPDGVRIDNDRKQEETQTLPWDKVYAACRVKNSIYLYAAPTRAFLLPDGQADAGADELWRLIAGHVKPNRLIVRR